MSNVVEDRKRRSLLKGLLLLRNNMENNKKITKKLTNYVKHTIIRIELFVTGLQICNLK